MVNKNIDIRNQNIRKMSLIDNFGGDNGSESYAVTDHYIIRNGKPCFPIMGEFHYSRYPAHYWEESILKMKAGGIDVIATYVFWIHHEETKGEYDWQGKKHLRRFLELCGKHNMKVLLRIGPWAHGECRNGGFPDWLVNSGIELRTNDKRYLELVKVLYGEIYQQAKGLLFDDGGPVIGVQLENEFGHCGGLQGEKGKEHIITLKKIAIETGFKVPFYSTTGWGNGIVVEGETLPVLGGYPEAPWDQNIEERSAAEEYLFSAIKRETSIGTDLMVSEVIEYSYDVNKYPYFTAELGGGLQDTHHRRPITSADDIGALAFAFLGSGANLLGYYMYHGGTNPIGKFSTFQESKATGYLNDVPELSYDFQAPINEYGQLNGSYGRLKALHMFLHDFGEEMAESFCCLPEDNVTNAEDMESLRYAVRFGKKGGFLFLNNYERRRKMTDKDNVNIDISTNEGHFTFDKISLPDEKYTFLPFNLELGGAKLVTATAQLLCKVHNKKETTFVFFCDDDDTPVYRFEAANIESVHSDDNRCDNGNQIWEIAINKHEFHKVVAITLKSGRIIRIITISRAEAFNAWKIKCGKDELLAVTEVQLIQEENILTLVSCEKEIQTLVYPELPDSAKFDGATAKKETFDGCFAEYSISFNKASQTASVDIKKEINHGSEGVSYELEIKRSKGESVGDDILTIPFEGDRARLYIDGEFSADWFYNGTDWRIGLKRFGNIDDSKIRLDIEPLKQDDYVFLERKPVYNDGFACSLGCVSILPEYYCRIKID